MEPGFLLVLALQGCSTCGEGTHKETSGAYPRACLPDETEPSADTATAVVDTGTLADPDTGQGGLEPTDTSKGDTSGSADTASGGTGDEALATYDCTVEAEPPTSTILLEGPIAYKGLVFDDGGYLIASDGRNAVLRSTYDGSVTLITAGLGVLEQFDVLLDGDVVTTSERDGPIYRIASTGSVTVIATDVFAYGLRVGPHGFIYAGNRDVIYKVDPETGEKGVWVAGGEGFSPYTMDFSPDLSRAYIGTTGNGEVFVVDLDAALYPVADPQIFARGVGGGWHDAVGVDICGYVYVADYYSSAVHRISPDGSEVEEWFGSPLGADLYPHGLAWGSGMGGWVEDAIYVPQPYNGNTVSEIHVGVPYRTWGGIVLGGP